MGGVELGNESALMFAIPQLAKKSRLENDLLTTTFPAGVGLPRGARSVGESPTAGRDRTVEGVLERRGKSCFFDFGALVRCFLHQVLLSLKAKVGGYHNFTTNLGSSANGSMRSHKSKRRSDHSSYNGIVASFLAWCCKRNDG